MAPPVAFLFFCSRAAPLAGTRSIPALRFSAFLLPLNLSTPHMRRFACPNSNERDTHRLFGAMEVGFHGLSPALPRRQSFRLIMADQERNQIATALFQSRGCSWGDFGYPSGPLTSSQTCL